ncbi:dihydroorotate dehydrogenase (quinone), mitochondrial [Galendromus occidentalis]|uniref:Dihydroorotate dehydrogenase (quinone), mitochondrial n=1 Tax=Galendromus occidentalis TaxID=34638 RepID=A0AAJ6QT06_9ACAR|nr:dihydroorotate dehydrogenase (quinone), mitochondrial [Galendromus occidentalis]
MLDHIGDIHIALPNHSAKTLMPAFDMAAQKLKSLGLIALGGAGAFSAFSFFKGDQRFFDEYLMRGVHLALNPENAHRAGVLLAKYRVLPNRNTEYSELKTEIFGKKFRNCVGLAAGFDKDGEAVQGLFDWGFGFVEVGSVTPESQPGNDKPRVFRLRGDQGIINRYGFNSDGHDAVLDNVTRDMNLPAGGRLGFNLGKNKTSDDAAADYCRGIAKFGKKADYIVINISSPNTPGLRALQSKRELEQLLTKVISVRDELGLRVPVLLKIAPDLLEQDKKDIAEVIQSRGSRVDGLIISNTTVSRPATLTSENKSETGGLSGRPLRGLSTLAISDMYILTGGRVPIIGVGGIFSGEDAYEKIKAGASMVQIYSSIVYRGPPIVETIKKELVQCLKEDGYNHVSDAVGSDHRMDALVSKLIQIR